MSESRLRSLATRMMTRPRGPVRRCAGLLLVASWMACAPDAADRVPSAEATRSAAAASRSGAEPAGEAVSSPSSLDDLYRAAAADLRAGKPLVVSVHVALCDNVSQGIVPVPAALGDGDRPDTNLYWGARYGVRTVFDRARVWTRETRIQVGQGDLLEFVAYRRRADPAGAWARRGVDRPFVVRLQALAWRGRAMAEALTAFAKETLEPPVETLLLGDGNRVALPDPARVVGFVGHNGLMDLPQPVWPFRSRSGEGKPARHRGVFALACRSRAYFADELLGPRVHNVALTTSLMAPEGYVVAALVEALADGEDAAGIRRACAAAYAKHQKVTEAAALRLFVSGP